MTQLQFQKYHKQAWNICARKQDNKVYFHQFLSTLISTVLRGTGQNPRSNTNNYCHNLQQYCSMLKFCLIFSTYFVPVLVNMCDDFCHRHLLISLVPLCPLMSCMSSKKHCFYSRFQWSPLNFGSIDSLEYLFLLPEEFNKLWIIEQRTHLE